MKCNPGAESCPLRQEDPGIETLLLQLGQDPSIAKALAAGEIDAVTNARTGTTELLYAAQQGLQASESRFRALVSAMTSAPWTTDATGRFIEPQRAWQQYTGQSDHDATGYGWKAMLHPDDRDRLMAMWLKACETGTDYLATGRIWHQASGSFHYFEARAVPRRDHHGTIIEWVGSITDIDHRVRTEQSLLLTQRALEASIDAVLIGEARDGEHPIVYVNPAFEKLTGYSAEEVLGKDCRFLQGEDVNQPGLVKVREALKTQTGVQVLLRNYRKDGSLFWNNLRLSPVESGSGGNRHFVGIIHDVSETLHYQEQLKLQATHDTLTGLANRVLMEDRLNQEITHARRNAQTFAVVFMDLDNFKVVNDSLGHAAGDAVLRTVADRLTTSVRSMDTIARYGGDEFVLILPGSGSSQSIREFCERLARSLREVMPVKEHSIRVNTSIGIAIYPLDGEDSGSLLQKADAAMYRAKELGRNRIQFSSEAINRRAMKRFETELQLRVALQRGNELSLHYQPQFELDSAKVIGFEALVRWNNPERGTILPTEFIPVAEQSGLIVPLGEWVLRTACHQLALWSQGKPDLRMSINLSAQQLTDDHFFNCLLDILTNEAIAPSQLEIELTETAVLNNLNEMSVKLDKLRQLGIRLAIDDFGTGYASLSQLKKINFDTLKLDKSFIDEITTDPQSAAIARMVMGLARSMCIPMVAEGIETDAQLRYLQRFGCELGQGYRFSKPVPAEKAEKLLRPKAKPSLAAKADKSHILILANSPAESATLSRRFNDRFPILQTTNASEALEALALHPCPVVIVDQSTTENDSAAFLGVIRVLYPESLRIWLHPIQDSQTVLDAYHQGWLTHCLDPSDENTLIDVTLQGMTS